MRDRSCQQSIKVKSIEESFALHTSPQKCISFWNFLKESSQRALSNHLKIEMSTSYRFLPRMVP